MSLRASSLPALAQCPCFKSGDTEWTESGTDRHKALETHFAGDDTLLDLLPDDERDGVLWAAEYIRLKANTGSYPITWEKQNAGSVILDDFTEIPGTPDAVCHLDIFDLKWRHRDYTAQMALYALLRAQDFPEDLVVRVHILYAAFQRATVLEFSRESALRIIEKIVEGMKSNPDPNPCDYCGWCAHKVTCEALQARAIAVKNGREDWTLESYHTSEITQPAEMAKAIALAKHLRKWCDAVDHFAKDLVIKQGVTIPGYELKSKPGKPSCADMIGAFNATGLTAEEFLQACEIRMSTSKDNSNKRGLIDLYALKNSTSLAAAKRDLKKKLEPHMRTPKETHYLKAVNSTEEEP